MHDIHALMHMDWDDIRVFMAIVRAGNLVGAARLCGQTQPTMGRRLKALEAGLGQTLFQRTSDGFVLTDEGATALRHAERMEMEATALARALAGSDRQLQGILRISSSDWFGVHVLAPACAMFAQEHPGVSLELVTDSRMLSLARRETDLAFRIARFEEVDVVQRRLLHLDYAAYRKRGDGGPGRLVTMDAAYEHMPDAQWLRRQFPDAPIAFRSNNRDAQARACAAGAGIAVLPVLLGDTVAGIERVGSLAAPPGRDIWLGYHRDLRRLSRLRAFLDHLIQSLA